MYLPMFLCSAIPIYEVSELERALDLAVKENIGMKRYIHLHVFHKDFRVKSIMPQRGKTRVKLIIGGLTVHELFV